MAYDVLIVPTSTIASKSVFSVGGRTLDSFITSLTIKVIGLVNYFFTLYYKFITDLSFVNF